MRKLGSIGLKTFVTLLFLTGCARVNIESKKPIKLDVTMRLDIYQHVAQDVQSIEDMISTDKSSFLSLLVEEAYAQEEGGFPDDVNGAIERRKMRRGVLVSWESKGVVGENYSGYTEIKESSSADATVDKLVKDENKDRRMIYQYVAQKNGADFEETARIFAKRIGADAPSGTPVETAEGQWTTK